MQDLIWAFYRFALTVNQQVEALERENSQLKARVAELERRGTADKGTADGAEMRKQMGPRAA